MHGRGFPNRAVPENLVPDYPPPVANRFNVGLLHTSLTGAAGHDTYAPCALRDLQQKGYDYWALGHVHSPQVLAERPWVVFAGNTQGRHVRETGPRGCRLVTVDDSLEVAAAQHRALDVVRWEVVGVDLAGADQEPVVLARIGDALRQASRAADGRLLAARILLTGATPLHHDGSVFAHRCGMVDALGYPGFFVLTTLMGLPVLVLVVWASRRLQVRAPQS